MLTAEAAANSNGGGATLVGQNCFTICERHRLLKEIGAKEENEARQGPAPRQGNMSNGLCVLRMLVWLRTPPSPPNHQHHCILSYRLTPISTWPSFLPCLASLRSPYCPTSAATNHYVFVRVSVTRLGGREKVGHRERGRREGGRGQTV